MSKLKSLCSVIVPMRDKPKKFVNEKTGVPWCRIEDIKGKYLYGTTTGRFVDRNTIEQMNLKIFPEGTVICACTGASIGTYAITRRDLITNQTFAGLVCGEKLYNHYLYYFVKLYTKAFIDHSVGCAQAYITRETFENIEISDISFEDQKDIVSLLELLDERIENNKAICADLEAMAKLIYDYWFVQFDFPDENDRPYKSSGGKMVWNEELKREIPDGWEVGTFNDCITTIKTGLNPRDNFNLNTGGQIRYITVKNITKEGIVDFSSCDTIDEEARRMVHKRSDITIGDILFASISPLGRCSIITEEPEDWDINESVFSIRPNYEKMTTSFLYMTFISETFIKKAEGNSTGSVFKGIRISELLSLKTIIPPKKVLTSLERIVHGLFFAKANAITENRHLASLRDFLLPMLMNGQVKVGETKE